MKRTHTCGQLTDKNIGNEVCLNGWCLSRRDHGGIIFIDLRDRYGLTQIVFDPKHNKEVHSSAEKLGREDVISVKGKVRARKEGMANQYGNIGNVHHIRGDLDKAEEVWKRNLQLFVEIGAKDKIELIQGWLAGLRKQ